MSNSKLISYTKLSPNHSGKRNHAIDTVSIHCMAGNLTVERCGELFANESRKASSNYGIGSDGRIALYVDEGNRSWCTSSSANDNRAVTIEVANSEAKDPWPVSDAAYESLIKLLVDICQRNGIAKLLWQGDKALVGRVDKQNMTVHRWFASKACPGEWLYSRHGQIAQEVNQRLGEAAQTAASGGGETSSATKAEGAKSFDKTLAGSYTVTASVLNLRAGAGTDKAVLGKLKKGTAFRCYGYYTESGGVKWLYGAGGGLTGYVSAGYVAKK